MEGGRPRLEREDNLSKKEGRAEDFKKRRKIGQCERLFFFTATTFGYVFYYIYLFLLLFFHAMFGGDEDL